MAATIIKAPNRRIHLGPSEWQSRPGTDFWILAGSADLITASGATNLSGLDSFGWTTTSLTYSNTVTGDFMPDVADATYVSPSFTQDASGDLIRSPLIFGIAGHQKLVASILGYTPTKLVMECYAAFTVASADETASYIGFHNGSVNVMSIDADGTQFELYNGSAKLNGTVLVDNIFHKWKISIDSGTNLATWYVDDVQMGTTLAIVQDVWPTGFGFAVSTTNRISFSWGHVWYE